MNIYILYTMDHLLVDIHDTVRAVRVIQKSEAVHWKPKQ